MQLCARDVRALVPGYSVWMLPTEAAEKLPVAC